MLSASWPPVAVLSLQEPIPFSFHAVSFLQPPAKVWKSFRASTVKGPGSLKELVSQAWLGLGGSPPWILSPTTQPLLDVLTPPLLGPQIQNLGLFPIHGVTMKITIPIATRGGNRLLLLRDFLTDQVLTPRGAGVGRGQADH